MVAVLPPTLERARGTATLDGQENKKRLIACWLFSLAGMVLIQVLLGGVTRLSESGLSIMEWAPIMGAIPPLSETEWQRVFAIYRQTGEYQQINSGMDLSGFKAIFWWEYIHRLWARLLAIAFLLPYAWFWIKGRLSPQWVRRLGLIFVLGALQGLMGWIMVASGFSERTDVSQYRLVLHLLLALLIYAMLLWWAFSLASSSAANNSHSGDVIWLGRSLFGLVALEIAIGGLVAGLNAGLIYNTFPLMGSGLVPTELGFVTPWWRDPLENPATAQFLHRLVALLVVLNGCALCWRGWRVGSLRIELVMLLLLLLLQAGLGVTTLLLQVPISTAVPHQACAFLLFGLCLHLVHRRTPNRSPASLRPIT